MTDQLQSLSEGRWKEMTLAEQLGNIGSEISRAFNWKNKGRAEMSLRAVDRALGLLDLSLAAGLPYPRLKELSRAREVVADYFYGENGYGSTEKNLRAYFDWFGVMARNRL